MSNLLSNISAREGEPLLPWRDAEGVSTLMDEYCVTYASTLDLLQRFSATRSATHATALCYTLIKQSTKHDHKTALRLLLEFHKRCRFRSHWGIMISLLSQVGYLAQKIEKDDSACFYPEFVDLCLSGLEMCEQMAQDHWYAARAHEAILGVDSLVACLPKNLLNGTAEGAVLLHLLERSKSMNARVAHPSSE
jgi:hypothetical protein